MRRQRLISAALILTFLLSFLSSFAWAQDRIKVLGKQAVEAKSLADACVALEELKGLYFKDNRYKDFSESLKPLLSRGNKVAEAGINYYIALGFYHQLKYLEEKQIWDEYFNQGNAYREEIGRALQEAIAATTPKDELYIYSRLLNWQFHKDQEDVFSVQALDELSAAVLAYAKEGSRPQPIKEAADKLFSYGEKGKARELYRVYVDKIAASGMKEDDLKNTAADFYKEGNLQLAEALYDIYIEKVSQSQGKEKLAPLLMDIARMFAYKDSGLYDTAYAEKIFKKIEETLGRQAFDEGLLYLRGLNLEKAKDYQAAKEAYINLLESYPQASRRDEALFKIGVISVYIGRDIKTGRSYFEKLSQGSSALPYSALSLYHLGLLSQWEGDFKQAKVYYDVLLEQAKDGFKETAALARERLKEIEEDKPLEYGLNSFLNASLKNEYLNLDMTKSNLQATGYRVKENEEVVISCESYMPETGCMQVEQEYLWSGHLGKTRPSAKDTSFKTSFEEKGTKEINLIVVSPTSIVDRNIEFIDVY